MPTYTLAELAERLDAKLEGDPNLQISGLGSLDQANGQQLSHLSSPNFKPSLPATRAAAVILREEDLANCPVAALVVAQPYLTFAHATQLFVRQADLPTGVHATAVVADSARIDPTAAVGAHSVVGAHTEVGAGVRIHSRVCVGERCVIGARSELYSGAVLYADVLMGEDCVIHGGAVLGADGFGFAPDAHGQLHAIAQLGGVRLGNSVSVGANSTIDRGALEDTVVEDGVKIDNQVQIGHNCHIGAHTVLCGCVAFAGSTRVGKHCVFAGRSGAGGDKPITICDGVTVSAVTTITQSIDKPGVYSSGLLHNTHSQWKRNALTFNVLDRLAKRVRALEKRGSKSG